jgi:cell division cycle 20-like protein 1 (cofactor of APC complex)
MFSPEYEKRLLKHCSSSARRLFSAPESSSPSDRFIPCRYLLFIHSPRLCIVIAKVNVNNTRLLNATKLRAATNIALPYCLFSRANNNWETNYSTLTKSNENSSQSKKQRECGESARDSLAYSCLLKNELLGATIEDIKNVSDENKMGMGCLSSSSPRGLFKYQSPSRQVCNVIIIERCKRKINDSMNRVRALKFMTRFHFCAL